MIAKVALDKQKFSKGRLHMHRRVAESNFSYEHLPNLQFVGAELWRGGQPHSEGFIKLKEKGVKTIVNLREEPNLIAGERAIVQELGLDYISIPLRPFDIPDDQKVEQFLELMKEAKAHSVFVHCLHGMDRTGLMCAIYRMSAHDWTFRDAYDEMLRFGFHEAFDNLRGVVVKHAKSWNKIPHDFE
ncbi:dual specificity protein phosphatase family protein [Candidatus Obscuribacterales bacterium]|nr:dual specificity protein phosphatase family protein [Candidatus Obscuribacterales bacterium]MBX3138737.1 dual specificity protein phosphatase family protein [Candidatus Obscuribacterales bacterium]MBX3152807.1 dual specificity protein phosphatase family protein [Candidatus Obscuribacterales bacterium]